MHFDEMPLVSCIMPTAGRPTFAAEAIRMFERQTYPNRELVIVDEQARPSFLNPPIGANIRYQRINSRMDIGSKRNLACALASGDIIVTWDDDDQYSNERIEAQVAAMIRSSADVVGAQSLDFVNLSNGERYVYAGREPVDCPGVTLAYRKDYWRGHPFDRAQKGEERAFLYKAWSRGTLAVMDCAGLITATIHAANTSPRQTDRAPWQKVA